MSTNIVSTTQEPVLDKDRNFRILYQMSNMANKHQKLERTVSDMKASVQDTIGFAVTLQYPITDELITNYNTLAIIQQCCNNIDNELQKALRALYS